MSDVKKIKFELILCIVAAVVVFIIWLLPTILNVHGVNRFEAVHQAISGLFAGLAFIGLVYTIILQREILDTQKTELKATQDIMNDQSKTMELQRFETTFFNLLSQKSRVVDNLHMPEVYRKISIMNYEKSDPSYSEGIEDIKNKIGDLKGNEIFQVLVYKIWHDKVIPNNTDSLFFEEFRDYINLYLVYINSLIDLVVRSDVQNKDFYYCIIRTSLFRHEELFLGLMVGFFHEKLPCVLNV